MPATLNAQHASSRHTSLEEKLSGMIAVCFEQLVCHFKLDTDHIKLHCLSIMFTLQIMDHHTAEGLAVMFGDFDNVCVCVTAFTHNLVNVRLS